MAPIPHRLPALGLLLLFPSIAWAEGSISVSSDPPGQPIYLDGVQTGQNTPSILVGLPPGPHRVEVARACLGAGTEVNVRDNTEVSVTLKPIQGPGAVRVVVEPPTAAVSIDGVEGPANRPLSCGEHSIRVALPGYLQTVIPVQIEGGRVHIVPVTLEALGKGRLTLDVSPDDAELLLDGRNFGRGDLQAKEVFSGPHELEVRRSGFIPRQEQFLMEDDGELQFTIRLDPDPAAAVTVLPKEPISPKPPEKTPKDVEKIRRGVGWGVAAVGLGVGIFGGTRFGVAGSAYEEYVDRSANGPGPESEVQSILSQEVVPARNAGIALSTTGIALLAGGITLAVGF
jgi:hypothetical protein